MQVVNASIITIGDELLIGQTIDTNSAFIAQELNKIGIWVRRRVAVGDDWDEIWKALDEESEESKIIIITGGLGPTADDITKPLLCRYFGGKLVVNETVLQHVKDLFTQLNRPLIERNLKQAEVPDVCTVLNNPRGTAPGMLFEKNKKYYFSLPGVPYEMKGLMTDEVIPRLKESVELPAVVHKTIFTAGQGESYIAETIKDVETSLPSHIKLAYLPGFGMVKLRLTARGDNKEVLEKELTPYADKLKELLKDFVVTDADESLETVLGKILKTKNKTMATAESCTGGYIAHLITSVPGSSAYYKGSVVSYANETKENILGVKPETLASVGAVSEETVLQMVKGVIKKLNVDYAVATSGIMGPDGGTAEKPVGTVWIGVGNKEKAEAKKFTFRFDRGRNIEQTALTALNMLRKFILSAP
jgi:nicotinamide-nucleotide amidase